MPLERYIVDYSAAVLAGRKAGNLFLYTESNPAYTEEFSDCRKRLCPFGISMMDIEVKTGKLIYVFRKDKLEEVLSREACRRCLKKRGYSVRSVEQLLHGFKEKIQGEQFPHEIGFILGYPVEDVLTYLEDMGKNPLLTGYWQVYHRVDEAKKTFRELTECSVQYKDLYEKGTPLEKLPIFKQESPQDCCVCL